jgi:glyceraldehyde-3-phosphate dehydrogenase (NAD(P))
MSKARVCVLGYGVIGRRVADAVALQDDMEVGGVAGPSASFSLRDAARRGFAVYLGDEPRPGDAAPRLCTVRGTLADLIRRCDVVLDCTPSGVSARYRELYDRHADVPVIVQGGEKHPGGGVSFNAFANYAEAIGRKFVRVISCSSTGVTRFVFTLDRAFGLEHAFIALVRRSADPGKRSKTPTNALTPVMGQSHHAPDVRTVLPHLNLYSMSVDACTTLGHVLTVQADLRRPASRAEALTALGRMPRVIVAEGLRSTADLAEYYEDLGRRRRDRPEIYVWAEGVHVEGRTVSATFSVHMESITIPETVDAVRAVLGLERDGWGSVRKTDRALGIAKGRECYPPGVGP